MATSKKLQREGNAYLGYREATEEEFGDALWYFAALCRRFNFNVEDIFEIAISGLGNKVISANDDETSPISEVISITKREAVDSILIDLGCVTANLFKIDENLTDRKSCLKDFAAFYLEALQATGLIFSEVVKKNLIKARGAFLKPDEDSLPDFDKNFPEEEQIPRYFKIQITQRANGQCYLRWNNVFIGAPLRDNIQDSDGYRFHDVFHFAFAAVLHWSPTFRALINQKRKSIPEVDEAQDSGRAIVVEEGLSAWLFSYSKGLDYFDEQTSVSLDVLKTIKKFVHGYEVEQCPIYLWKEAIIQGYSVFRQVKENNGGIVIGDREQRKISYRLLGEGDES